MIDLDPALQKQAQDKHLKQPDPETKATVWLLTILLCIGLLLFVSRCA